MLKSALFEFRLFHLGRKVMAAVMLQAIPSYFRNFSENSPFISSDNYENFLVTRDYCVAAHDSTFCSLKYCQYHILLIADKDMNGLFTKLDRFCFNFQRVDCFSTLYKHRFSGSVVLKSGEIFDTVEREQFLSTSSIKGWTISPALLRRDSFARNSRSTC